MGGRVCDCDTLGWVLECLLFLEGEWGGVVGVLGGCLFLVFGWFSLWPPFFGVFGA